MKKRILSVLLCVCMLLQYMPMAAFAVTADGLCAHHTEHMDCDYVEGVSECTYHCAVCAVQDLVDALPEEVSVENLDAVKAALTAIDTAKAELSDAELAQVDFAKYTAAISAINALEGLNGAEVPMTAMQIFIQVSSGTPIALEVELTDRIEDIKLKIQDKTGIAPQNQRLLYADKQLEDGNTLEDYSIQKDATITVVATYDVWVAGQQFTSEKLSIEGDSGTATYNPATKTLTMNGFSYSGAGALIEGRNYAAIGTTATELNIVLAGANSITCSGDDGNGIYATNNINISGSRADSLTISSGSNGIYTSGGKLSVKNTEVKIAAAGRNGFDVKGFTADNAVIDMAGVVNIGIFSADFHISICNKSQVKISADYKAVYAYNSHITVSGESSLVVEGDLYRYNSNFVIENSTLTCDDLTIDGAGDIAITDSQVTCTYLETDELTVTENSVLTCGDIVAWEDVTITASEVNAAGSITAQTLDADWNWIPTNIIITDASVTIAGDEYGITANTQIAGNSTVTVQGANAFNAKPTLEGTFAVYAGDDADSAASADASADATYANKYVKIVPAYPVWVGGEQFTSEKLSIEGNSGTATYDPESKTLTLNNFSHTSEGHKFNPWMGPASIYAALEHLTVNIVGSNTVACSAENGYALYNYGALTITTDDTNGSLALTGDGDGIWVSGNLIINGCQVNATGITSNGTIAITNSFVTTNGARHGIAVVHAEEDDATEMKSDDLTITNSTVVATGGEYALFYDGGHNEEDESSIRGGLIPKLVFDNKFATVAGSDAESAVMAAADAAATYENKHVRIVSVHDVTYKADGQLVGTVTVEHGKDATAPAIPAKEGYNETAPKWDKDGKNITADTVINAVYTKNESGEYSDVTPDTNVGGGKLTEEIEELKEKVPFTQEEEKQIEYGADVEVWLEIKDISDSVSAEDKAKVDEKLGDGDVALYLDIAMFKQVGENEASRLTQLGDRVQICFKLADSLINTDKNVTRTYSIIRVHNGKAEIITPVFDAATKTLTFETDRFSTYAVVYTDVENVPPTQETTPPTQETTPPAQETTPPAQETTPPAQETTPPTEETVPPTEETVPPTEKPAPPAEIPATGDSFQPAFWIACMTLSIFGIAVLLLDAKRRHAR